MLEAADVKAATNPHEVLLVADALTGQDAVNTARAFDERLGVTGIVLTRMDGDARGGAALSMRAVTGKPIKLVGTGEKVDALEEFHPSRVANRILGMGDIVSLVEKAAENFDQAQAQRMADKMRKGKFDLEDMRDQLAQMEKIGGIGGMLGMLPGIGKMKAQLENANIDDSVIKRQRAIIDSMTPKERRNPDILKASRKKRIAAGSGAKVEEVNKLLKMHRQMADVMKMMGGGKGRGMAGALGNMFGIGKAEWAACRSRRRSRSRRCRSRWAAVAADWGRCPRVSAGLRACRVFPAGPKGSGFAGPRRLPLRGRRSEFRRPRAQGGDGKSEVDRRTKLKGAHNVPQDPSDPWWREEASLLPYRRGRCPFAPRRPFHRQGRHLRPDEAEG